MSDDLAQRLSELEARVASLEAHRAEQMAGQTAAAIRKLIAHRDEGVHVQLVLSFKQVVALADLFESLQPALTGVAPAIGTGQGTS